MASATCFRLIGPGMGLVFLSGIAMLLLGLDRFTAFRCVPPEFGRVLVYFQSVPQMAGATPRSPCVGVPAESAWPGCDGGGGGSVRRPAQHSARPASSRLFQYLHSPRYRSAPIPQFSFSASSPGWLLCRRGSSTVRNIQPDGDWVLLLPLHRSLPRRPSEHGRLLSEGNVCLGEEEEEVSMRPRWRGAHDASANHALQHHLSQSRLAFSLLC